MLRTFSAFLMLIGLVLPGTPARAASASASASASANHPQQTTHLGSTWDAPDTTVRIFDHHAISADVSADRQLVPTDNPVCELYTTTLTITWNALNGHLLTSTVNEYDDFSSSYSALNTTTYSKTPTAQVQSDQSPVLSQWYRKDTHKSDPTVCPRDSRSVNYVEIRVDGSPRHQQPGSIVKPPSADHLAVVWTWFEDIDVIHPTRVQASTNVYREMDDIDGPCEVHVTELDLFFTATGSNRIIAIGERSPGSPTHYQRGDDTTFVRGIVAQQYYLDGTHTSSKLCPRNTVSQNRIEIYTEATRHH